MPTNATVLGTVQALADGSPIDLGGPRQRRIFAALVVQRGAAVSADQLVEVTFGDEPPDAAWRTLRTYVARLRRAFEARGLDGSQMVVTVPAGYAISADISVDADRFETLLRATRDHLDDGEPDAALATVDEALMLWSGQAYAEFAAEKWARPDAVRLDELRLNAKELRGAALVESGHHDEAIADIGALAEAEPLREEPRRLLMLALYRSGRHAEALRVGRSFRTQLADDTGLEWSTAMADLAQMILDRDPRLDRATRMRKLRGYLLGEVLADAPHGVTHRATQPSIGRDVAITIVPAGLADDVGFVRRFERHAQRIASIEHPNVVPLYDYWREPGGAYLVTRYMAGGSLEARLDAEDSVTFEDAGRIIREIGDALNAAADRGVAHGQVSPAAILFDDSGRSHLAGFSVEPMDDGATRDVAAFAKLAEALFGRAAVPAGQGDDVRDRAAAVRDWTSVTFARSPTAFAHVGAFVDALLLVVRGEQSAPDALEPQKRIEGPNPYRGLFAFQESDADVFFGRRAMAELLAADLRRDSFLALVGPSGSGKSSVARAGLLPLLRQAGALVTTMVPGSDPIAELEIALSRIATSPIPDLTAVLDQHDGLAAVIEQALPSGECQLVLLIDQLEEVLFVSDATARDAVFGALQRTLLDPRVSLQVAVTVRADFLGRILEHPVIGPLVRDHSRLITPLDSDSLYESIVEPAAWSGVSVEPELASALVADAIDSPGSLPLLQFALTELYEHRVEGTMTLDAYRRTGGLVAAITHRAEEVYDALSTDEQQAARRLFSRLINSGDGSDDTRRKVLRCELASVPTVVLDAFGSARLLTFDRDARTREPSIEIAHEALIRRWARLRSWIDEDRTGMLLLKHLNGASGAWQSAARDPAELYRGARLATAEEWAEHHPTDLTALEIEFLHASASQRDRDVERDRRNQRRLRRLVVGISVVALLAFVAGATAIVQRGRAVTKAAEAESQTIVANEQRQAAEDQGRQATENADAARDNAREADRNALVAEIERLTSEATAVLDEDPDLPILLGLEAYERSLQLGEAPSGRLIAALQTAVQQSRVAFRSTEIGSAGAVSPSGDLVASRSRRDERELVVVDPATGEEIHRATMQRSIETVAFDATGERMITLLNPLVWDSSEPDGDIATGSAIVVQDVETFDRVDDFEARCCLTSADFSPDGRFLAAQSLTVESSVEELSVSVWDLQQPDRPPVSFGKSNLLGWLPDSRTVALLQFGGRIRFVDAVTGVDQRAEMQIDGAADADLSDDGHRLVVVLDDGSDLIEVWKVGGSEPLVRVDELNPAVITTARLSPDGNHVIQYGADDDVRVTSIDSGDEISLVGSGGGVERISTSADGSLLLASGRDSSYLWDLSAAGPRELRNLPTEGTVDMLRFSADGSTAIAVEHLESGTRLRTFDLSSTLESGSTGVLPSTVERVVASDGGLVAFGSNDATTLGEIRSLEGSVVSTFDSCDRTVSIDDQGRWLVLSSQWQNNWQDGRCGPRSSRIVDPTTGASVVELTGRLVDWAMFGPTGTIAEDLLVSRTFAANDDGTVKTAVEVRRLPSGDVIGTLTDTGNAFWRPFFSADGRFITIGSGGSGAYAFSVQALVDGTDLEQAIVLQPDVGGGVATYPDAGGGWFVVGQSGELLRFYDLTTGTEEMTLPVDTGSSTMFRITADGRTLYYQAGNGVLRRFPLDPAELVDLARTRVQRDFTAEECARFSIADDCSGYGRAD